MEKQIDSHYVVGVIAKVILITILILFVGSFFFSIFYKSINYEWVRVAHPDYGFAYQYPTKWSNEFFGEAGYRGSKETKALLSDSPFFGIWIRILVIPYDNEIADNIVDWNRLRWHGKAVLTQVEMGGETVWRSQLSHENSTISELIYLAREKDFILIWITGKENQIKSSREEIERFLISFESFAEN